jgi:lipopolysaccharide biosynthesis glycosyltransferase
MKHIQVAVNCDTEYIMHLAAMLESLFDFLHKDTHLDLYILYYDMHHICFNTLKTLHVNKNFTIIPIRLSDEQAHINFGEYILPHLKNNVPYYRLFMGELIRDVSKILYLDCDVIIQDDITPLFDLDVNDVELLAVREPDYSTGILHRFNSGVMLANLDKWRENRILERGIEYAQTHPLPLHDQSVLNAVIKDWKTLDYKWNALTSHYDRSFEHNLLKFLMTEEQFIDLRHNPKIVHYNGSVKPWNIDRCKGPLRFRELYRRYRNKTPWKLAGGGAILITQ